MSEQRPSFSKFKPVNNPPNPWHSGHIDWLGEPPTARLVIYEEEAKKILSENQSPDLPFRWSMNPYRGCYHGCAYCYARPSHQYLDFGAGTDFERRIIVKMNAAERLRKAFDHPRWIGESITLSGNTDPFQPIESTYKITRACLEVMVTYRNPVVIITKGSIIRRDIDLLSQLAAYDAVLVYVSIPFLDEQIARQMEPGAPPVASRLKTIEMLADAGIPVGISLAPLIPGLSEEGIPELLRLASENGATFTFTTLVRLPGPVEQIFEERIREIFPERSGKILNGIREMKGGVMERSLFGERMTGMGPRWRASYDLFALNVKRYGYNRYAPGDRYVGGKGSPFRRPFEQLSLF